mgnify:CR=1 FL=1
MAAAAGQAAAQGPEGGHQDAQPRGGAAQGRLQREEPGLHVGRPGQVGEPEVPGGGPLLLQAAVQGLGQARHGAAEEARPLGARNGVARALLRRLHSPLDA